MDIASSSTGLSRAQYREDADDQQDGYTDRTDTRPEFFNFIGGLRADDLVAELIQNEIDAGSTETIISFENDQLVCSGNGEPIDDNGFLRLSYLRGAGDRVPRKRSLIGVKNHGIKASFTIGNEVFVRSAGRYAHQTLYRHGEDKPPSPAALQVAAPDPTAPERGCRVEIPYRRKTLRSEIGEPLTLETTTPGKIAALFRAATDEIPSRFLGTVRSGLRENYAIELRHHELGSARFEFTAGRPLKWGRLSAFIRTCVGTGAALKEPIRVRERAVIRTIPRPQASPRDVSMFYEIRRGLSIEVAWEENDKGRPLPHIGMLRYPLAYADTGHDARSGFSAHFSAPFVSDTERHGLAGQAAAWNDALIEECDSLLADCIKELVPKHGSKALDVLGAEAAPGERLERLVLLLAERRGFPVEQASSRIKERGHRRPRKVGASKGRIRRLSPRDTLLVVPCYVDTPARHSNALAEAAPAGEWLLDADVSDAIRAILTDKELPDWGSDRATFDEEDALNRLLDFDRSDYPWASEDSWRAGLSDPSVVRPILNAIFDAPSKPEPPDDLFLPDSQGEPQPFDTLYWGLRIPADLPGVALPPLIHPALADHPIFRRKAWKRPLYRFEDVLDEVSSQEITADTAQALFRWLVGHAGDVPSSIWPRLKQLPIWPDENDEHGELDRLCLPSNSTVERILGSALRRPSRRLRSLAAAMKRRRLSLAFRQVPNAAEIDGWIDARTDNLPMDRALTPSEQTKFKRLESEVAEVAAYRRIRTLLGQGPTALPSLTGDGFLAAAEALVSKTVLTQRLCLLQQDLGERSEPLLNEIWPLSDRPTADMLRRALVADPQNVNALIPRLSALADACGDFELGIEEVPCIPLHGHFYSPNLLCFRSNKGSYWGSDFRREITGKGIAQVDQQLYIRAGVLPAEPTATASRQFFAWLAADARRVEGHLPEILRHFAHERGVRAWWHFFPQLPSIPVVSDTGYGLVSRQMALSPGQQIYLNDFPALAEAIKANPGRVRLIVDRHEDVRAPITELLADEGIRSLRRSVGSPESVQGVDASAAPAWVQEIIEKLRSPSFGRSLQKRLVALELPSNFINKHWQSRIEAIQGATGAAEVFAAYRLGRQRFRANVEQAFDPATGQLWLRRSEEERNSSVEAALFRALAERIFVDDAPQYCFAVLSAALETNIVEAKGRGAARAHEEEPEAEAEAPNETDDPGGKKGPTEPGQAPNAHHDWRANPKRNVPNPKPIPPGTDATAAKSPKKPANANSRPRVPVEEEQLASLKEDHYAWHCQIGLAKTTPNELAPMGSYVELQENRSKLIDAHHADAVDAGGVRHAGNVLILSHFEHHRIGRKLSRAQITEALKKAQRRTVKFGQGADAKDVEGFVASVTVPSTAETVPIFFTAWHRTYWLEMAE
ncbi:MAG: hypothetical protein V4513_08005 [Pseudomonadota bacterium]